MSVNESRLEGMRAREKPMGEMIDLVLDGGLPIKDVLPPSTQVVDGLSDLTWLKLFDEVFLADDIPIFTFLVEDMEEDVVLART
jgi:hypothetical protein